MKKDTLIDIYIKEGHKDSHGAWIEDKTFIKNINVDIQPYSTELLLKTYGYNIQVTVRIFADKDENIKVGTILKYTNKLGNTEDYEVRKIIDWDNYLEVFAYGV